MGKKSLAALLCATMAMTACMLPATAAMADEPLKIEFFQQKGEEGPQKGYKEIIDKFNKENSDIEIEMNTVPDAGTVLTSRISSGDIPVIFSDYPTQTQFKQKVANGYVQDLSDQDFLKNVNESALEMTKQEDGGYYALPYSRNYIGVYYNKKTFEDNGLEIPTTWEEFTAVCDKLKEAGITPVGMHGKDPARVGHLFQAATVAWAPDGVETIGKVVSGEAKIEGDEEFKNVFEKMNTLLSYANEDALALSDTTCYENFVNGEYAMTITGSYARGTIQSLTRIWKLVYSHFQMILMMILSAYPVLMLQFVYLHRQVIRKKMQHIDSFLILLILKMHRYSAIMTVHHPVSQVLQAMMME